MLEYRPRPPLWRLALVSASQFILATWLVGVVLGAIDTILVRSYQGVTLLYATPWDTLHRDGGELAAWAGYAFCAFALLLLYLWPSGRTLRGRHFHFVMAMSAAVFGAIRFGLRGDLNDDLPLLGALALAGFVVLAAESRALALLGNVYDLTFGRRLKVWAVRLLPTGLAFAYFEPVPVAVLLGGTLLVALIGTKVRFEQVVDPEMRSYASVVIGAVLVLALSIAAFGLVEPKAVVVEEGGKVRRVAVPRGGR
ncbi:MAG TPA: hypothetical protein VF618_04915 [Thermoanaerobaculia bacterium]